MHLFPQLRSARLIGLVAAIVAGPTAAVSQGSTAQPPAARAVIPDGEMLLLSQMPTSVALDRYLEQLRTDFFILDADSDGKIIQRDADLHTLMETIEMRTNSWTAVMRYDLDGDGSVTEDEARRVARYDHRTSRAAAAFGKSPPGNAEEFVERIVGSIMELDTDKDGKVGLAEAGKFRQSSKQQYVALNGQSGRVRRALTLEGAAGELSLANYQAAGEMLFRKIDADNDGKISPQELDNYRRRPEPADAKSGNDAAEAAQKHLREQAEIARKKQEAIDAERAACAMPAASEKAKIVLLGSYETEALSSVTIGSQDAVVHAGRVNVEPGDDPLYVVIASYRPTIWQFSGAVERVERVVLTSLSSGRSSGNAQQSPAVGATGIPRERISLFSRSNCLSYFSEAPSSGSLQAVAAIRLSAGKSPDVVAAKLSVGAYNIPSGRIDTVREQRKQGLVIRKSEGTLNIIGNTSNILIEAGPSRARDDMQSYWPGGVVEIDPKAVVASEPVATYEVLPAQAGLVQLLANGTVTQNSSGEFIVRKNIRFPPGLYGAHSVTFLIMKGAPYPEGDPGHSCVIVEETGESKGAVCRSR
ncbi:EF-hand domain-containing protein [Bradyrhizobium sp. Leo170]|uniref:EF-hand domain-containing protein n=1 Tax=Bradyrhizobium sp. Leo170 TaxID=1571199 RepID=UPI0013EECE2C|nr:EF-hand domain-containing protein [Bradyrhizobium sp. Leo170]